MLLKNSLKSFATVKINQKISLKIFHQHSTPGCLGEGKDEKQFNLPHIGAASHGASQSFKHFHQNYFFISSQIFHLQ